MSDTAGIRVSNDEIESKGIDLALNAAENADLNLIVLDPKSVDFREFLAEISSDKAIFIVNKADLGIEETSSEIKKYNPIYISVKEEKNLDKLITLIKENLKNKFHFFK